MYPIVSANVAAMTIARSQCPALVGSRASVATITVGSPSRAQLTSRDSAVTTMFPSASRESFARQGITSSALRGLPNVPLGPRLPCRPSSPPSRSSTSPLAGRFPAGGRFTVMIPAAPQARIAIGSQPPVLRLPSLQRFLASGQARPHPHFELALLKHSTLRGRINEPAQAHRHLC